MVLGSKNDGMMKREKSKQAKKMTKENETELEKNPLELFLSFEQQGVGGGIQYINKCLQDQFQSPVFSR